MVLFFGKAEYEGLSGGYRYESHGGKMLLTDPDGDVIETKRVRQSQKHTKSLKTASEIVLRHQQNGFQKGDRVEARWQRGRHYYMACITRVHDDGKSFDLLYDDGFVEKALPRKFMRRPERDEKAIASEQTTGLNSLGRSTAQEAQAKPFPSSTHPGLTWDPESGKWKVSVSVDNRVDVIGSYTTKRYAMEMYEKAIKRTIESDTHKGVDGSRHDKQTTSRSSKQTSARKATVNFNKMEYRTEKTFEENVQVVPRPQ